MNWYTAWSFSLNEHRLLLQAFPKAKLCLVLGVRHLLRRPLCRPPLSPAVWRELSLTVRRKIKDAGPGPGPGGEGGVGMPMGVLAGCLCGRCARWLGLCVPEPPAQISSSSYLGHESPLRTWLSFISLVTCTASGDDTNTGLFSVTFLLPWHSWGPLRGV